jgi:hypothetical protein
VVAKIQHTAGNGMSTDEKFLQCSFFLIIILYYFYFSVNKPWRKVARMGINKRGGKISAPFCTLLPLYFRQPG